MPYPELPTILSAKLGLEHTPIALAFVEARPDGVAALEQLAPSTCSLWRTAEKQIFYASASDHRGCAVGAHVMGLPLLDETQTELAGAINLMDEAGYLPASEVASIPQVEMSGNGIVYGPLADFPLAPDAVVLWVNPAQAMLLEEALSTTSWNRSTSDPHELFGRPACGAVARAINARRSALSLGCIGMRTYTDIPADLNLLVIPGSALGALAEDLPRMLEVNGQIEQHHQARKLLFA